VNADHGLWSATWSPSTPTLPVSPTGTLPLYIRTPHTPTGTTTVFVASQPGSPNPASSSVVIPYSDPDEDDTLYPAQYTVRRDGHMRHEDDDWSHIRRSREEEGYEMVSDQEARGGNSSGHRIQSEFITTPDHTRHFSSLRKRIGWSHTFMLGGRVRRISLQLPTWTSVHNFVDFFGLSGSDPVPQRRKDRWMSVILDGLSVFWPAAIVWVIINWTIL